MSKRAPSILVSDILHCIGQIERYTKQISFDEFTINFMVAEACLYNIQVIGEAVARLPDEIKESNPQVPWSLIKGMRNRLIHEYFGTDLPVVWNVVTKDLPSFKTALEQIFEKLKKQQ